MDKGTIQRQKILKAAYGLFREHGHGETTTRDIAAAAEINKGLLHYYYHQKDDIIVEMYHAIIQDLMEYLRDKVDPQDGLVEYACLNILFFRLNTFQAPLAELLTEMILNPKLTQVQIDHGVAITRVFVEEVPDDITDYQLLLAMTAAVGAESQLFLSIRQGRLKMSYEKLSTTVTKLFFTMLKIGEERIQIINEAALARVGPITGEEVYEYIRNKNPWMQD